MAQQGTADEGRSTSPKSAPRRASAAKKAAGGRKTARRGTGATGTGSAAKRATVADPAKPRRRSPNGRAGSPVSASRHRSGDASGVLGRVARTATERVARGMPRGDLGDRDVDHICRQMPFLRVLSRYYFRADIRGLEEIPATGPVLLIGNHSGGNVAPDIFAFVHAFIEHFGPERKFYQLAHNLVILMGVLFPFLPNVRKFGTMTASHENAERALDAGAALLVYPGGDYEVHRPSWDSAKVDFGGRKGFITLARKKNVPIVPVVAYGGQETALFLSRGERLARLLRLDKMFRLKVLPISIAAPWGLNIGDMAGHIPLPAKITIQVLPPIDLRERFGARADPEEIYEAIMDLMQEALTDLAAERTLPIIG